MNVSVLAFPKTPLFNEYQTTESPKIYGSTLKTMSEPEQIVSALAISVS